MQNTHDWLAAHRNDEHVYLTTTGRKSGQPHRIEMSFAVHDDQILMLASYGIQSDWIRNMQADPAVTLELGGEIRKGIGRLVDPSEPEDAIARFLLPKKYNVEEGSTGWPPYAIAVAFRIVE